MQQIDAERVKQQADLVQVVGQYLTLKRNGNANEMVGLCPFHKEKTPSFTVTRNKQLYYCFGCQATGDVFDFVRRVEGLAGFQEAVNRVAEMVGLDALSMPVPARTAPANGNGNQAQPKVVATYQYVDEHGALLYEVQRIEPGRNGKPKDFRQRRVNPADGAWVWGISAGVYRKGANGDWYPSKEAVGPDDDELPEVRRVLYRLPAVLAADLVYVVEGEKDVHTLEKAGLVATTNSGGAANKWLPEYTEALRGRRVVIIPDNDEPGQKRAKAIASALQGKASEVLVVEVPSGKDATDFIEAGNTAHDIEALVEEARRKRIADEAERRGLLSPREIVEYFDGGVNAFLDPSQRAKGLETGFHRLDEMTLGMHGGELVILAARPAQGKTALALNIATHVAEQGKKVAIFSLEMSRESLLTRMVCSKARVDQMKFRAGYLNQEERHRVLRSFSEMCSLPVYIDDNAVADLKTIRQKLTLMRATHGLDLVVIDYLQLMNSKTRENRNQEVGALSRGLKLMARECRVPFLVLSQLSRAPEARPGNHRPQLSDLRDSGGIEQDCDVCLFVYREEVYKPDRDDLKGLAELIVAKQRNGPIGTVKLTFLRELTKFENHAGDRV